jgi:hypothetical protein
MENVLAYNPHNFNPNYNLYVSKINNFNTVFNKAMNDIEDFSHIESIVHPNMNGINEFESLTIKLPISDTYNCNIEMVDDHTEKKYCEFFYKVYDVFCNTVYNYPKNICMRLFINDSDVYNKRPFYLKTYRDFVWWHIEYFKNILNDKGEWYKVKKNKKDCKYEINVDNNLYIRAEYAYTGIILVFSNF